jgi:hypothetical protein
MERQMILNYLGAITHNSQHRLRFSMPEKVVRFLFYRKSFLLIHP